MPLALIVTWCCNRKQRCRDHSCLTLLIASLIIKDPGYFFISPRSFQPTLIIQRVLRPVYRVLLFYSCGFLFLALSQLNSVSKLEVLMVYYSMRASWLLLEKPSQIAKKAYPFKQSVSLSILSFLNPHDGCGSRHVVLFHKASLNV